MSSLTALRLPFEQPSVIGRPSCPDCGKLAVFSEKAGYLPGGCVGYDWTCDYCSNNFKSVAPMTPMTAVR